MVGTRTALLAILLTSCFGLLNCAEESKGRPARPAAPVCEDTCDAEGAAECRTPGFRVCGDADSNSCLEWSAVVDCPSACIDG